MNLTAKKNAPTLHTKSTYPLDHQMKYIIMSTMSTYSGPTKNALSSSGNCQVNEQDTINLNVSDLGWDLLTENHIDEEHNHKSLRRSFEEAREDVVERQHGCSEHHQQQVKPTCNALSQINTWILKLKKSLMVMLLPYSSVIDIRIFNYK